MAEHEVPGGRTVKPDRAAQLRLVFPRNLQEVAHAAWKMSGMLLFSRFYVGNPIASYLGNLIPVAT